MNRLLALFLLILSACSLKTNLIPLDHPALIRPPMVLPQVWEDCENGVRKFLGDHPDFEDFTEAEKACAIHKLMTDCVDSYLRDAMANADNAKWRTKAMQDLSNFKGEALKRRTTFCNKEGNTKRVQEVVDEVLRANSSVTNTLMCPLPNAPAAP